jgi:hypothetical protein
MKSAVRNDHLVYKDGYGDPYQEECDRRLIFLSLTGKVFSIELSGIYNELP